MATDPVRKPSVDALHRLGVVCPVCYGQLAAADQSVSCLACGRVYPIRDGLPVLIAAEVSRA